MKILLDTHIFLWSLSEPEKLSRQISRSLEDPENELWVSPITTWEIMMLAEKKRIVLKDDPFEWIRRMYSSVPFKEAALNHEVALQGRLITLEHQDPADRFLVATALVYDLTFATVDSRLVGLDFINVLR